MRTAITLIPLLLVNTVAVIAQQQFWSAHLPWGFMAALFFALALESVAVFLAYNAHLSQLANDSAMRLQLAAIGTGLVIGLLNGSHYMDAGTITAAAVGVGFLSAVSPWLWAVHTRRTSRDSLKAQGLIDAHALRLGAARWLWHPVKSWHVMRGAVWTGETLPAKAIGSYREVLPEPHRPAQRRTEVKLASVPASPNGLASKSRADAIRYAVRHSGKTKAQDIADWLTSQGVSDVTPAYVRQVRTKTNA